MLQNNDRHIGRILDTLQALGLAERTGYVRGLGPWIQPHHVCNQRGAGAYGGGAEGQSGLR